MKLLIVFVLLLLFNQEALASNKIQKGDYLFLSARLVDCSDSNKMIDYAKVSASGDATFFKNLEEAKGIRINVLGKRVEEAEELLLNKYFKSFGYRPNSFSINKTLASAQRELANLLFTLTQLEKSTCRFPDTLQNSEGQIAYYLNSRRKH